MSASDLYLIWSNEHRAWWKPNFRGYTSNLGEAGRYGRSQAIAVSAHALGGCGKGAVPPELPIAERDVTEWLPFAFPRAERI